jgi:hypothetical protein
MCGFELEFEFEFFLGIFLNSLKRRIAYSKQKLKTVMPDLIWHTAALAVHPCRL